MKTLSPKYNAIIRLIIAVLLFVSSHSWVQAQCYYIPSTSLSGDTLSYSFSGGSFASYGCSPIDPTFWLSGQGNSVTVTFVHPQSYPSFRVWGMNDDDVALVSVNDASYPLTSSSASYDPKVVCGLSPGSDGVIFLGGNLVGANSNAQGNYSYQNVQLNATNVTTITVTGISGAGWGFAGVSVNCPYVTGNVERKEYFPYQFSLGQNYPNPFNPSTTIEFTIPNSGFVSLKVYNIIGQEITTLVNEELPQGNHKVEWKPENLSSGVYFYKLETKGHQETRKLVLLR